MGGADCRGAQVGGRSSPQRSGTRVGSAWKRIEISLIYSTLASQCLCSMNDSIKVVPDWSHRSAPALPQGISPHFALLHALLQSLPLPAHVESSNGF